MNFRRCTYTHSSVEGEQHRDKIIDRMYWYLKFIVSESTVTWPCLDFHVAVSKRFGGQEI